LLIGVVSGELLVLQVVGNALAGLINARGAGAQHDGDALAAEGCDGLLDSVADLQGGFEQQLVVAAVLRMEFGRDCSQLTVHRTDGH